MLRTITCFLCGLLLAGSVTTAAEPKLIADADDVAAKVKKAVDAVGGEEKLLKLFSLKETLVLNPDGVKKGSQRTSVLEPPNYWWLGKVERVSEQKEPATFLVWAWTLGAITDPKSKLTAVPDVTDNKSELFGIEVSGTITPPMKLYFDKKDNLLFRIDWRGSIHRFSEWKETDGVKYPSRTIGHYQKDDKIWYQTDILEVTRLKELPKQYKRPAEKK